MCPKHMVALLYFTTERRQAGFVCRGKPLALVQVGQFKANVWMDHEFLLGWIACRLLHGGRRVMRPTCP